MRDERHSWWARAERLGRALETWLIVALLSGLIVLASAQIVLRNFFSIGLDWGDGLTRVAVFWLAMLGALAASREGRHVTMGAVTRWLPRRWQVAAGLCADLFGSFVSAVLAWYAAAFVQDSRDYGDVLLTDVPAWWLQAIMPLCFALIAVQFFSRAVRRVRAFGPGAGNV